MMPGSPAGSGGGALNGTVNDADPFDVTAETVATFVAPGGTAMGPDPEAAAADADAGAEAPAVASPGSRIGVASATRDSRPSNPNGTARDATINARPARTADWISARRPGDGTMSFDTACPSGSRATGRPISRIARGTRIAPWPAIASVIQPTAYGRSGP